MAHRSAFPEDASSCLFAASRAKIIRAKQFISELESELADYIASEPLTSQIDVSSGTIRVSWAALTLKPGAIAGDAIHNLRASLDLAASELARLNNQGTDGVYFPFAKSADEIDQVVAKRFAKTGNDAIALVKSFKPYGGGNLALRGLHDLDIEDKHTGILLGGSTMQMRVEAIYHSEGAFQPAVKADLASLRFLFVNGPFATRDVIETLQELVQLVEGILKAFASLVAART